MNRWHCYLMMLVHDGGWLRWALPAVIVCLIGAGFIHSVWAGIVAVCFSLLLGVMVMSFVIMVYGFNSVTGLNMTPHSLVAGEGTVRADFEEGRPVEVSLADVRPYTVYPGGALVPVAGPRKGWLWVPPDAFDSTEEMQRFLQALYRSTDKCVTTSEKCE